MTTSLLLRNAAAQKRRQRLARATPLLRVACTWLVLVAGSGCRDAASLNGTALLLSMDVQEALGVDQLRARVHPAAGEPLLPTLAPERPGGALGTKQSLRLLLPDSLAGQTVVVTVEGLAAGRRVAQGDASAEVKEGREVEVSLRVLELAEGLDGSPGTPDAPDGQPGTQAPVEKDLCRDTRCAPGQRCVGGECLCDPISCDGCCDGNVCVRGDVASACGSGGAQCDVCPSDQRCNAGVCTGCNAATCPDGCCSGSTCTRPSAAACGAAGNACQGCGVQADRCSTDGRCLCGAEEACGSGQRCQDGRCICDETTCAGCCVDGQCRPGDTTVACGAGGATCTGCDLTKSDNCSNGLCGCGVGPACGEGLACEGGTCVCNETSCEGGCCRYGVCLRGVPPEQCESGSDECGSCNVLTADNCFDGRCQCGSGESCAAGQACVQGQCVCIRSSCAGCCSGNLCMRGNDVAACGRRGAACEACDSVTANNCFQGGCRCGHQPACKDGKVCNGSRCVSEGG